MNWASGSFYSLGGFYHKVTGQVTFAIVNSGTKYEPSETLIWSVVSWSHLFINNVSKILYLPMYILEQDILWSQYTDQVLTGHRNNNLAISNVCIS